MLRMLKLTTAAAIGAGLLVSLSPAQQTCLTTTFASNNGQSGNMFDLVAKTDIKIKSFDVNVDAGTWDFEVYTKAGTWVGSQTNPLDWTLVGSATGVTGNGLNVPTPLPIPIDITIAATATQAFYVTVSNGTAINYTNGSATGTVFAEDANLQFLEGAGKSYPFGATFQPRVWNGNICYVPAAECWLLAGLRPSSLRIGNDTLLVDPLVMIEMTLVNLPVIDVPNNQGLIGASLFLQSFMYNPAVYPNDPVMLSAGLDYKIGVSTTPYGTGSGLTMWPIGKIVAQPGGQITIDFALP